MSKKNIIHILEKFKANTDANATNQGFYYQYLITLDNWLDNYVNKNDVVIYCETEDDIKAENLKDNTLKFTQVKAYSRDFSIKSDEIQKAIINFFHLDIAYRNEVENLQFIFHTNSNFKDGFFEKHVSEVRKILNEYYDKKFNKEIEECQKKIKESEDYLDKYPNPNKGQHKKYNRLKKQLSDSRPKKTEYENELKEVKDYIEKELSQFIDKIQWEPLKKEKENAIEYIIESILEKIDRIDGFKLDIDSAYAYLIKKVVVASQSRNIEDRKLDNRIIDKIIEEFQSIDKFKNSLQNIQMLSTFHNIFNEQKSQTKLLKNIDESVNAVINYDELRERLKYKYQTFEKLPLLLDEKKQNNVSDLIINLETIKENNQKKEKKEEKEIIQIDTMLERLSRTPKLLIYGDAGIGKTTLCKYIAYKWAKDKLTKFDYVIYLPLRVWESKGLAGVIKDYYYNEEENRSFELIDNIENDSQDILFLFDGYDELNEKKKSDFKQNHLSKLKNYIIVSRPTGYNENEFNIDKAYKSIGYLPDDISEYIDRFFDSSQQNLDLKHFLEQNNSIAYLARIPLMLEIICVLWMQKKSKLSDSI